MPNPKRRHSCTRRDKRRANWKLTLPTLVKCDNPACEGVHMPHHVCPTCGTYNGRQVLTLRRGQATAEA
ncbi:MAG TPA: 50S ribosomal protein L32 [Armatimonadota bacterium]